MPPSPPSCHHHPACAYVCVCVGPPPHPFLLARALNVKTLELNKDIEVPEEEEAEELAEGELPEGFNVEELDLEEDTDL
jgi:hypothetical protein